MKQIPDKINEAIRLFKSGDTKQSRDLLRDYICNTDGPYDAMLWLAKVSPNNAEALTAAQLTYHLDPTNEIAQRAVISVRNRTNQQTEWNPHFEIMNFTGMTVAQARAVNWSFKGLCRPIGVLVDEKCIDMKDLAWAAQNAFDEHIQRAAKTVLLSYLLEGNSTEAIEPAKVIHGKDFSGRIERISSFQGGTYFGLLICLLIIVFGLYFLSILIHVLPIWIPNLAMCGITPLVVAIYFLSTRSFAHLERARAGKEGENKVLDHLRASLRSPWKIYHNLGWSDRKWGDIDFLVFGPGGIWVFEAKAYQNPTRNIGDRWQYKSRWGWRNINKHPGLQARRNAVRIKDYLANNGIHIGWIQAVIVWASEEELLFIQDPAMPVWRLGEFQDRIEELWRQNKLSAQQIADIDKALQTLASRSG